MKTKVLSISLLLCLSALPGQGQAGWITLKWMERPAANGPSASSGPIDRTEFQQTLSFNPRDHNEASWQVVKQTLREGDVIAYREETWQVRREIFFLGKLNRIPYGLFEYGHLAMVVKDPDNENGLRLLSSWSFGGPNIDENLDSLRTHSWELYRLDRWEDANKERLSEFISLVREKAEKWYGYDFSGMFGLWNSNLQPNTPNEIGHDYTCATVVLSAFHYSGVELDGSQRHGIADIVTPLQVVSSKGRLVAGQPRVAGFKRSP